MNPKPYLHMSLTLGGPEGFLSDAEAEVPDVAVTDFIVSPFGPQEPALPCLSHGLGANEIVVGDDLGADEPALQVAVDGACRLWSGSPVADCPGPNLIGSNGEER